MKLKKTASGKQTLSITREEWLRLGEKKGWLSKKAAWLGDGDPGSGRIQTERGSGSSLVLQQRIADALAIKPERVSVERVSDGWNIHVQETAEEGSFDLSDWVKKRDYPPVG
jgi:hypothetical protein